MALGKQFDRHGKLFIQTVTDLSRLLGDGFFLLQDRNQVYRHNPLLSLKPVAVPEVVKRLEIEYCQVAICVRTMYLRA